MTTMPVLLHLQSLTKATLLWTRRKRERSAERIDGGGGCYLDSDGVGCGTAVGTPSAVVAAAVVVVLVDVPVAPVAVGGEEAIEEEVETALGTAVAGDGGCASAVGVEAAAFESVVAADDVVYRSVSAAS